MKKVLMFAIAILFNCLVGSVLASFVGIAPGIGALSLNGASLVLGNLIPGGSLGAGLYAEVWTGEMIKKFRDPAESLGWYGKIRSYDQYAQNDVIHFVHIGGDPTVLVNNTSYPLGIETLADADKPIGLDKYQTKATAITDDEVNAITYDKMGSVIERHKASIDEKKYAKAIHALAPSSHAVSTPVIVTTGDLDADGLRKVIKRADIIALKKAFDKMKVPTVGRVLVLCNDHVNDLLDTDQKFADQYHNYTTGKISNMYGFEIYEYQNCPYFNATTKAKVAFGTPAGESDRQASVAFYAPRMMKANGTTKAYLSEAKSDPLNQQNLCNFRHYSICLPLKNEAIGAIVSALPDAAPSILSAELIDAVPAAGATYNRTVSAPSAWAISTETSWLTVSTVSGKARIVVAANTGAARSGSYLLSLVADPTVTLEVTVNQVAAE